MNKTKKPFFQLTFIFSLFVLITLFFSWISPMENKGTTMSDTMGNSMKQIHLSNINIYDLFKNEGHSSETKYKMTEMHTKQSNFIKTMAFWTTTIVFLLIPFTIGGSLVLFIIWFK